MVGLITPGDIFAAVLALMIGGLLLWQYRLVAQVLVDCMKALEGCLRSTFQSGNNFRKKLFSRTTFFWVVNIVFMAISAYHAAPFFGSVISSVPGLEAIGPYIGLPVAFVMDGITIVFMQARLEANYKHDKKKSGMYIRYVFAGAALNTLANLYTDIQHFDASKYNRVGDILLFCAPLVLSIFPMFLVAISKAADEMVNVKPLEDIDVEEYRKDEEKRVSILEAQNEFLDREAQAEQKFIEIEMRQKENERRRKGKSPQTSKVEREFLLARWFFPQRQAILNTPQIVNETVKAMKDLYEPRLIAITQHNQALQDQLTLAQQLINDMLLVAHDSQSQIVQFQSVVCSDIETLHGTIEDMFTSRLPGVIGEVKTDLLQSLEQGYKTVNTVPLSSVQQPVQQRSKGDDKGENTSPLAEKPKDYYGLAEEKFQELLLSYPSLQRWQSTGARTASIDETIDVTNHSRKMIANRVKDGTLKKTVNPNVLRIDSIVRWLLQAPLPKFNSADKTEDSGGPNTGEIEAIEASNNHHNGNGNGHKTDKLSLDDLEPLEV